MLIFILLLTSKVFAQDKSIGNYYLQLFGIVKEISVAQGKPILSKLDSAVVEVYNADNVEIFSGIYDTKKRVSFKLPLNENYTVVVFKEGYVSKCFLVNTIVATQKVGVYNFSFEVILFKKIPDLIVELVEPVAIVQFFSKEKKFDYDYEYTEEINAVLKEKYKEYYITEDSK